MENINIRVEEEKDWKIVEELTREAFWNVYKPGCDEHFVLHNFRSNKDFIKELSLVLEKDNIIIGHIMYSKAFINCDDGEMIPIVTFGPVSIHPMFQKQGYGKILVDYSIRKAKNMGFNAICITGNINFYKNFGFEKAYLKNIRYSDFSKDDPFPYLLLKELTSGFTKGINGSFSEPSSYFVNKDDVEEFDKGFPYKEKKILEGQFL